MDFIDQITSMHADSLTETYRADQNQNQSQNGDRVLNPETRRALGRELRATGRLWAVVLAFVPFVYASAFLWTLDLSIQLFLALVMGDALAGIAASMYVAIRLNLILRPRSESQSATDADATSAEGETKGEAEIETEAEAETVESGPEEAEQAEQPEPEEADDHKPSDPERHPDGEPADEQAETQSTHDTDDTSSNRIIS